MALRIYKEYSHNKVKLVSGQFYKFRYSGYQGDPAPVALCLNVILGRHPNTNHQWRLTQMICTSYIPRKDRIRFVELWMKEMNRHGRVDISWDRIKREFPYMQHAIRRYLLKPNYYIRNLEHIPFDKVQQEVVKGWMKDFSSTIFRKAGAFAKRLFVGRR